MVAPFSPSKTAALRFGIPAAFALLVAVVYADPLFAHRSFTGRDLLPYGFPTEKATHDAWARGILPIWNDDVFVTEHLGGHDGFFHMVCVDHGVVGQLGDGVECHYLDRKAHV